MKLLGCILVAMILGSSAVEAGPLQVSANGRYLVDDTGQPFLINGDSAWSLFAQPTLAEARMYLQDRADLGFNFIAASLIEHKFATNAPQNANGDAPFVGAAFGTPNEAYFVHADSIVDFAASLGIVLFLAPVYVGFECGDEGWCQEMQAASLTDMRNWGRFVGQRYGGYDNIMWSIGGDADPAPVADKLREFVLGLREFDSDDLISAHNHRDTQAVTYWPAEPWLQVNNTFASRLLMYRATTSAYQHSPTLPFIMLECFYENEHDATLQQLRAQSYWSILTGACGVVFGNCPLWHFGYSPAWCELTNWEEQLAQPGSAQMTHYRTLFESRRWEQLVPDLNRLVLVSGNGINGSEEYATAAAAADGSSIIAYAPTPRAMAFDTGGLTGSTVRAWWFDPDDASSGLIGDFPTGTVNIASWPSGDRVIVLDDAALGFGAPGTPLPTSTRSATSPLRLHQNAPNPFNPTTTIRFELAKASHVQVTIFDSAGRSVRHLLDRQEAAGAHVVRWDGKDDRGRTLSSGIYFYQLQSEHGSAQRKMVLLK